MKPRMLPILKRAFFIAVMLFAAGARAAPLKIPDVAVTDQDGKRAHFYSGLVRGHTVVVNFIFTRCTTICGTMGANFGRLQRIVGPDVELISVSVDPLDTPLMLKAWGERWDRGPRWTLVTGAKTDIDALRRAFGVYSSDFINHSAVTFIGNDTTGEWTRVDGLAPSARIASTVSKVASKEKTR
jgi:protein SCO1/2